MVGKNIPNFSLIVFLILILIISFISYHFLSDILGLQELFAIYVLIIGTSSTCVTIIIIGGITEIIKDREINWLKKRFKKKPKIFEMFFFMGLFWATAFLTISYSVDAEDVSKLMDFVNNFGMSIFFYGFAFACGWLHYIKRYDVD
jgi:hypothetical protein